MAKRSRFIGLRLHPDNEQEAEALKILDALIKDGFTARQIFTDALLKLGKRKPEMFQDYTKQVTKPYLEALLEDFARHLLGEMRSMSFSSVQSETDNDTPLTEDEDKDYEKNLVAGYLARRKR